MGQVIMPEILSDHDLDWGGTGTPIAGGNYFATTELQTIIAQGGDYSVQNPIVIGAITLDNLTPANVKKDVTITVNNGRDTWSITGTGGSSGTGGYKLKIITGVARIPADGVGSGYLTVIPDTSDTDMRNHWRNCAYISVPASSISDITPKYIYAVRDLNVDGTGYSLGGGFIKVDEGVGYIGDGSVWSGEYRLQGNESVAWCNHNSGIRMPISTGYAEYYDDTDGEYYTTYGPSAYMIFVVGSPL